MQSRQSYIDALNAGRERKSLSAYDQLDDTLSRLEERLNSLSRRNSNPEGQDRQGRDSREEIARRLDRLSAPKPRSSDSMRDANPAPSAHLAPGAGGSASMPVPEGEAARRMADSLKHLRDELKSDISTNLSREFEVLRRDIEKAYVAAANGSDAGNLSEELDRIAEAVALLAERQEGNGFAELQAEMGTIKRGLAALAREETLNSQFDRWKELSGRLQDIEQKLESNTGSESAELEAMTSQLQKVAVAIANLPASLPVAELEGRVRALSENLETFADHVQTASENSFGLLESRLDEINRAIVASSVSTPVVAKIDNEPLDRIEARISSLSEQLETLSQNQGNPGLGERIEMLGARIEEFAEASKVSGLTVEKINDRLSVIAEKMEAVPASDKLVDVIGQKIDSLASQIVSPDFQASNAAVLEGMQKRLDDIVSRLDHPVGGTAATDTTSILHNLESQLKDISGHLSQSTGSPIADIGPRLTAIETSLAGTREILEAQLADLSVHLSASQGGGGLPKELLPRLASIETALENARENLGSQLAEVSGYLSGQSAGDTLHADLPERLAKIESALERTQETVLGVARIAAEEAVKSLPADQYDDAALRELTMDLKDLEQLTRKSEERNARTFEAIHDTLLKIVDHLGDLEAGSFREEIEPGPDYQPVAEAPSLDDGIGEPLEADIYDDDTAEPHSDDEAGRLSPAEAAAAAAMAALENRREQKPQDDAGKSRKSVFSGLGRAFSSRTQDTETEAEEEGAEESDYVLMDAKPEPVMDESPASDLDDSPLEPGSGAPDLSAIMNKVRDDNTALHRPGSANTAQSDFIAAARRAAQAAAAEADLEKRNSASGAEKSRGFSVGNLLGRNRKALMMGVAGVLVLVGAYQLGSAFLNGDKQAGKVASIGADQSPKAAENQNQVAESGDTAAGNGNAAKTAETVQASPKVSEPDQTATAATPQSAESIKLPAPAFTVPPFQSSDQLGSDMNANEKVASIPDIAVPDTTENMTENIQQSAPALPESIGPVALRTAVEKGDAKAMFEVATRYAEGRGVQADAAAAADWYKRAATLGLAAAQYRYGSILEKGTGVTRDLKGAMNWYQMAAQQGNASAMHNLAVLFAMGAVGPADNEAAVRWFKKAAELGVTDSQYNLGIMAAKGAGMPRDLEESYKWFALAAKTGDKDAAQKRDEVAKSLEAPQLAKARATVKLWSAKTPDTDANSVQIPDAWTGAPEQTASVDMKKAVTNVQILLANKGYHPGTPDGVMGERTKSAIIAYQKDNGLEATGEIDEPLVRKLLGKTE